MRAISMAAVSAIAMLTASAYAQAPATSPLSPRPAATTSAPANHKATLRPDPLQQEDVSMIEGASVLGSDGRKLGSVSDVLMQPDDKKIDRLVVHVGGLLGMGGRRVALPLDQFS